MAINDFNNGLILGLSLQGTIFTSGKTEPPSNSNIGVKFSYLNFEIILGKINGQSAVYEEV